MTIKDQIFEDLKQAMKNRETDKVIVLRTLNSAIKDKEIELIKREKGLSNEEIISVILKEAKKRKDAISEYQKAKREELSEKEKKELVILQNYLPKELSKEEIDIEINKIIKDLKPENKNFSNAMKTVIAKLKGKADGKLISDLVKEKFN